MVVQNDDVFRLLRHRKEIFFRARIADAVLQFDVPLGSDPLQFFLFVPVHLLPRHVYAGHVLRKIPQDHRKGLVVSKDDRLCHLFLQRSVFSRIFRKSDVRQVFQNCGVIFLGKHQETVPFLQQEVRRRIQFYSVFPQNTRRHAVIQAERQLLKAAPCQSGKVDQVEL